MPKCPNCSAPLKMDQGGRSYRCEYCGAKGFAAAPADAGREPAQAAQPAAPPIIVNLVQREGDRLSRGYPYRSRWAAFFLCLMFGCFGAHRFYVGKAGTGLLWLLTLGLFGIGWTADLVLILFGAFRDKAGYPLR
ncbi:MAG: NINE protein [Christensenellales bacterium]